MKMGNELPKTLQKTPGEEMQVGDPVRPEQRHVSLNTTQVSTVRSCQLKPGKIIRSISTVKQIRELLSLLRDEEEIFVVNVFCNVVKLVSTYNTENCSRHVVNHPRVLCKTEYFYIHKQSPMQCNFKNIGKHTHIKSLEFIIKKSITLLKMSTLSKLQIFFHNEKFKQK